MVMIRGLECFEGLCVEGFVVVFLSCGTWDVA
jgi:hypothetical protein